MGQGANRNTHKSQALNSKLRVETTTARCCPLFPDWDQVASANAAASMVSCLNGSLQNIGEYLPGENEPEKVTQSILKTYKRFTRAHAIDSTLHHTFYPSSHILPFITHLNSRLLPEIVKMVRMGFRSLYQRPQQPFTRPFHRNTLSSSDLFQPSLKNEEEEALAGLLSKIMSGIPPIVNPIKICLPEEERQVCWAIENRPWWEDSGPLPDNLPYSSVKGHPIISVGSPTAYFYDWKTSKICILVHNQVIPSKNSPQLDIRPLVVNRNQSAVQHFQSQCVSYKHSDRSILIPNLKTNRGIPVSHPAEEHWQSLMEGVVCFSEYHFDVYLVREGVFEPTAVDFPGLKFGDTWWSSVMATSRKLAVVINYNRGSEAMILEYQADASNPIKWSELVGPDIVRLWLSDGSIAYRGGPGREHQCAALQQVAGSTVLYLGDNILQSINGEATIIGLDGKEVSRFEHKGNLFVFMHNRLIGELSWEEPKFIIRRLLDGDKLSEIKLPSNFRPEGGKVIVEAQVGGNLLLTKTLDKSGDLVETCLSVGWNTMAEGAEGNGGVEEAQGSEQMVIPAFGGGFDAETGEQLETGRYTRPKNLPNDYVMRKKVFCSFHQAGKVQELFGGLASY